MREPWHPAEDATLRLQYPHMKTAHVAAMLGRSISSTFQRAYNLGLKKSEEFFALPASGRTNGRQGIGYRFTKGHVPANKGRPYREWGKPNAGQFKPGVRHGVAVRLYKPIGTLRLTKDGYLSRKVNDGMPLQRRWRLEHLVVWEAANGPVPKGFAVCFKNGDRKDVRLDNLHLLSRSDLMRRNTVHNYPQPIPKLVQLRGALQRQINRRKGNGRKED